MTELRFQSGYFTSEISSEHTVKIRNHMRRLRLVWHDGLWVPLGVPRHIHTEVSTPGCDELLYWNSVAEKGLQADCA